jgi:Flp pilus assembly pilin Flp
LKKSVLSFFKSKPSGQGLVEYALILVLIAVVVIAALQIISTALSPETAPVPSAPVATATPDPAMINQAILAKAPFVKEGVNTPFSIPFYPEEYLYSWYLPGCHPLIPPPDGFGVKVGTIYEDATKITVSKKGNEFTLCNNLQGAQVAIVSAYVELPR